jgi:hypothetical protein
MPPSHSLPSTPHTAPVLGRAWGATLWPAGLGALLLWAQVAMAYLAWTVLAHLGTQHTWLWWGGMSALVLWWSWRVWQPDRAWVNHRGWHTACWLMGVIGLCVLQSPLSGGWMVVALWLMAAAWAGMSNALQAASPDGQGAGSSLSVHVLMHATAIACVVGFAADVSDWRARWLGAVVLMSMAYVLLVLRRPQVRPGETWMSVDPTMAVMMGSLTLMTQWCIAQGLSAPVAMAGHLGVMALASCWSNIARDGAWPLPNAAWAHALSIGAAVGVLWSQTLSAMLLAMGLLALGSAWLSSNERSRPRAVALWLLGVSVLVATAQSAPTWGPAAIGWGLLCVSGARALLAAWTSHRRDA